GRCATPTDRPVSRLTAKNLCSQRSSYAARAVTSPLQRAADDRLVSRVTAALLRVEICLHRGAEVRACDDVAVRTGERVLNERPRARRLSDTRIELSKLGCPEPGPCATLPAETSQERPNLAKGKPGILT